jgi:hypothetical protein
MSVIPSLKIEPVLAVQRLFGQALRTDGPVGQREGGSMRFRGILAVSALIVLASPVGAATQDCPTLDGEEIVKLLTEAPSCDASMKLFEACSYGAGGDTELGEVVQTKCEAAFLGRLSKPERKAYDGKIKACDRKYAKQSGTMYRSFEAFCRAGVAQTYARRVGQTKK